MVMRVIQMTMARTTSSAPSKSMACIPFGFVGYYKYWQATFCV